MKRFTSSLIFGIVIFIPRLFAQNSRNVTIPINGYGELGNVVLPISLEWNESWLAEKSAFDYHHEIARVAGALCTISYTDCSERSDCLMAKAYSNLGFAEADTEYFYDIDYDEEAYGINQTAFSFASKKIAGGRNLIFVVIRGTPEGAEEWLSNLNVNDSRAQDAIYHEGFFLAVDQLQRHFAVFVKSRALDLQNSSLVITGHSRGAAVANLFAALLSDENLIDTKKTFVYTFAAPNVTTRSDAHDAHYNFIWNIVNGEDLVPTLPPSNENWKFTKFGITRTLVNSWNCENPKTHAENCVAKVNALYNRLLGREYFPFGTGPFIGVKLSDTLTSVNKDSEKYYKGFFPIHEKASRLMKNIFTQDDSEGTEERISRQEEKVRRKKKNNSSGGIEKIASKALERCDTRTRILIDYSMNAFVDMHAMQMYFSWIYSLDESEAFSERESTIVRLSGNFNGAVVDERGNIYAKISDGVLELRETRAPIAAWQIPVGNFGPISIGFPSQEKYSLLIYKDSILPTPIKVSVERYSSKGIFSETISKKIVGAHAGIVYNFAADESNIGEENEANLKKLKKQEAKLAIKDGQLKTTDTCHMNFELHFDTDGFFEFGVAAGLQKIYIEIMFGADLGEIKKTQVYTLGIGTQHSFCGPFMINAEAFAKFAHYRVSKEDKLQFTLVPALRVLFSIKPAKRFQFFLGGEFNFCIEEFNGDVFENGYRNGGIPSFGGGKLEIYPAIQFGVKL